MGSLVHILNHDYDGAYVNLNGSSPYPSSCFPSFQLPLIQVCSQNITWKILELDKFKMVL